MVWPSYPPTHSYPPTLVPLVPHVVPRSQPPAPGSGGIVSREGPNRWTGCPPQRMGPTGMSVLGRFSREALVCRGVCRDGDAPFVLTALGSQADPLLA